MAIRTTLEESEHDRIVSASAATYGEMQRKGYKVSTNPGGEKNQFVGPASNPRYPDVVVWLPDSLGSARGTAVIIEEIETAESVSDSEAEQWKDYGSLGIKFLLIVPSKYCDEALRLISKHNVNVSEVWYYYYELGNTKFVKYR
ncbi:MAG: hypothetical protein KBC23_00725 [Candidatus Omnitrophica bacterium]|nr:hypothetical protein [Candidatus Omnitrophota bacterium]